jgi:hypothetical protein
MAALIDSSKIGWMAAAAAVSCQPLVIPHCVTPLGPPTGPRTAYQTIGHRNRSLGRLARGTATCNLVHDVDGQDHISLLGQTNWCGPCCLLGRQAVWFELTPEWAGCASLGCQYCLGLLLLGRLDQADQARELLVGCKANQARLAHGNLQLNPLGFCKLQNLKCKLWLMCNCSLNFLHMCSPYINYLNMVCFELISSLE